MAQEVKVLFQVTHTHTEATCPGVLPDKLKSFGEWWHNVKTNPDLKVLGGYISPMDHVFHITIEADDFAVVVKALGPLNSIGSGQTTPVITIDQAMPFAEAGVFRAS
jgi:hypothetical protein